ncbi:multi-sensor signal transduction histidine kinase [Gloeothece citriformis PCC 7424]|uniref:histidine kinase n=1 Tax=Gloeothece citriformis (strain PCC 7424) TaxID=65393 RepID=B7KI50_GLOC7|nr:CHASE3 domain-containing protein [Gloeothece citriformis]ACK73537.1 multi-sensor signal transduction histidine kinase [Gloeothece citriformis PCC 7424]
MKHRVFNCFKPIASLGQKLTPSHRGSLIISIPVICLFTSLGTFAWLKNSLIEDETWVQHTQKVRLETKQLLTALVNAETGVRGYGMTGRSDFLDPYHTALKIIPQSLNELEILIKDNPQQTQQLQKIRQLVTQNLETMDKKVRFLQSLSEKNDKFRLNDSPSQLYDWLEEGKVLMDSTREEINIFAAEEERLLEVRQDHLESQRQTTSIIFYFLAFTGTISGFLAIHLFRELELDRKEREKNLQATNQQLSLVCEQLQRFTANASHELRAPLAAILSNAQMGLLTPNQAQSRHRLEKVVELTKSMSVLVNDLLFLARYEGVNLRQEFKVVDLVNLLQPLTQEWQNRAYSYNLTLTSYWPQSSIMVMAESNLLRQAIVNLLSNACRYTPAGGSIYFKVFCQNLKAIVEVEDNGIGIPTQDLPHIFERFYRVDTMRSRSTGGFGLGLAITKQIIEAHGGHIDVSSTLEKGTIFQIILPVLGVHT